MRKFRAFLTAGACSVALATVVHAADMPGDFPLPDSPVFTDLVSGWYVRADFGRRWQKIGNVDAPPPNSVTGWAFADTWTGGFGAGWKYKWFRTDVTFDYAASADFRGDTVTSVGYYNAKVDSFSLLANAYLDLGTWWGFT